MSITTNCKLSIFSHFTLHACDAFSIVVHEDGGEKKENRKYRGVAADIERESDNSADIF
jgi:hypothetical protein